MVLEICISKGATMIYPNETFDAEATLKQFLRKKQLPFMEYRCFFAELILTSNNMTLAV
jgi:hypothetical protein